MGSAHSSTVPPSSSAGQGACMRWEWPIVACKSLWPVWVGEQRPVIGVPGGAPIRLVPERPRFCRFGKLVAVGLLKCSVALEGSHEMSPSKFDWLIYFEPGYDVGKLGFCGRHLESYNVEPR